jgi:superfamily I DNA and/or RNA helicase
MKIDCLIIDEAGQISLCSVSLVLRSLASSGRIIIAGDSEQLAPILSAQYPLLKSHALFGSVLDCLMYSRSHLEDRQERDESQGSILPSASSQGTVVQLTENFRYVFNPFYTNFLNFLSG